MTNISEKLQLSILELFSVLLPGGIMGILLYRVFKIKYGSLLKLELKSESWQETILSLGIVYFIGYALYVGSSFMDKWYNSLKLKAIGKAKENQSDISLTKNDIVLWARHFILPDVHNTHNLINDIIDLKPEKYKIAEPIDAFQWSYRYLMIKNGLMFSEVERYYATARFFRSMTLVFFLGSFLLFSDGWLFCSIFGGLTLLSFWLFLNRWQKANHVAFKNVLIINSLEEKNKE